MTNKTNCNRQRTILQLSLIHISLPSVFTFNQLCGETQLSVKFEETVLHACQRELIAFSRCIESSNGVCVKHTVLPRCSSDTFQAF